MGFFDLNVPYLEGGGSEKHVPNKSSKKDTRLKIVVKAMELGYTGVAFNRSIKGVMSNSDRCTISLFPLSSLLKVAPSLSTSVKFHRELLGLPSSSPFRQYTRLTVIVDSSLQIRALNSGNPVLKTYDLVAVRPLNQVTFEEACKVSEVDLIAIDFSQNLPFRLKLPMVKAAIERGIYFEITYSPLISDIQARRQMISNAKLLVDWTRGKNLIFSSASPTVNELRGPYDVANLSSLFGLSMERAKAAISKNCRTLIAGSLKKKKYFKEAIKIEKISSGEQMESEPWFVECHNWDQISSGDGDLLLDDISKMFSSSAEDPKILKAIDFTSISEGTLLNNMQLMDSVYGTGAELQAPDNTLDLLHAAKNPEGLAAVVEVSNQSNCINEAPNENWTSPLKHQTSGSEGFLEPVTPNDTSAVFICSQKETPKPWDGELRSSNSCDPILATVGTELHDIASRDLMTTSENLEFPGDTTIVPASDACNEPMESGMLDVVSPSKDCISPIEGDLVSSVDTLEHSTPSMDIGCLQKNVDAVSGVQDIRIKSVIAERVDQEQSDFHLSVSNVPLQDGFAKAEGIEEHGDGVVPLVGEMPFPESYDEMKGDADLILDDEPLKEVLIETEEKKGVNCQKTQNKTMTLDKSKLGKSRLRRISYRPSPFPFKCLLKHVLFKKSRKIKDRIRIPSHIC